MFGKLKIVCIFAVRNYYYLHLNLKCMTPNQAKHMFKLIELLHNRVSDGVELSKQLRAEGRINESEQAALISELLITINSYLIHIIDLGKSGPEKWMVKNLPIPHVSFSSN